MKLNVGLSLTMKKICVLPLLVGLSIFASCQKQQTDAERQAEIDRQVQQRLDAEHQAQEKDQLAQRQSDLDAREKALSEKEAAKATPVRREREPVRTETRGRDDDQRGPGASYDTFYTKLDSYGDWRETSDYGYVFQPRQAQQSRTWRPYTDGRWVYTEAGWTWVSEEAFGWATYHYGRWTRLRNIGWVWVPGDEWAPAWVSWRKSDDYVGWAPLPPEARFDRRTGIHNWSDNYYDIGPDQYCFVSTRDFGGQRAEQSIVPVGRNVTIINQTTNVTNITYNNTMVVNQGPNYDELRTQTQRPIERLRLERDVNVNVNIGDPHSVIRGEVVAIPAPFIRRAQSGQRPSRVKESIAHVAVETGWDGISDRQVAEKTRVKMRTEATPPANLPSKIFVRPTQPESAQSPSPAVSASPVETAAPVASATPFRRRPGGISETPTATPNETFSPAATPEATPFRRVTPEPTATVTSTPTPIATPTPISTIIPRPVITPRPPVRFTPSPSPETSSSPISAGGAEPSDVSPPGPARRGPKPLESAAATTPPAFENKRQFKKEEKRRRKEERREGAGQTEPGSSPETTAPPQQ